MRIAWPRLLGLMAGLLWVSALAAPVSEVIRTAAGPEVETAPGHLIAMLGWLGPLELCPAWYANLPLAACVWTMLAGNRPGRRLAWLACGLALSSLLPHLHLSDSESSNGAWSSFYGPGLWLWLAAFAPVAASRIMARGAAPR